MSGLLLEDCGEKKTYEEPPEDETSKFLYMRAMCAKERYLAASTRLYADSSHSCHRTLNNLTRYLSNKMRTVYSVSSIPKLSGTKSHNHTSNSKDGV